MNRTKVEDVLLSMGIPVSINGFTYIVDAMDIIEKKGLDVPMVKELYHDVAVIRGSTFSKVERSIRYALEIARSCKNENRDVVEHYLGAYCVNSSSLKHLYKILKREEANEIDSSDRLIKVSDLEKKLKEMADSGNLLAREGVTQEDLLLQILGNIINVTKG